MRDVLDSTQEQGNLLKTLLHSPTGLKVAKKVKKIKSQSTGAAAVMGLLSCSAGISQKHKLLCNPCSSAASTEFIV